MASPAYLGLEPRPQNKEHEVVHKICCILLQRVPYIHVYRGIQEGMEYGSYG